MITSKKDNLFHVLAAEVAKEDKSELYLVAGIQFETVSQSPEVRRVLEVAMSISGRANAADALAAHFHMCVEAQTSDSTFCDGCGGFIHVDRIVVQFAIRKISDTHDIYRVLFVRVDAGKLAVDMNEKMEDLQRRVQQLEDSAAT
jgi:hypothetical protein